MDIIDVRKGTDKHQRPIYAERMADRHGFKTRPHALTPLLHYIAVLVAVGFVLFAELRIPGFASGLRVTPFFLITTLAAMLGGFGSGIFAILISGVSIPLVIPPEGWAFTADTLFKVLEFVLIGGIIFVTTWRGRTLHASNIMLREMTKNLHDITASLQEQAQGDKRKLDQLNEVNRKLKGLVDQFIKDDEYWGRKVTTPLAPQPKHIANTRLKHDPTRPPRH